MVETRAQGRSKFRNVCRIFVVSNAYKKKKKRFLKDALWGGGGPHRSWPGGRGGRPRALVAGEGWGYPGRGCRPRALIPGQGVREGLAWRGKAGYSPEVDGGSGRRGKGSGGGARASVPGG